MKTVKSKTIEYLKQLIRFENIIDSKYEECQRLRSLVIRSSPCLLEEGAYNNQSLGSRLEDYIIEIIGLEEEIKTDISNMIALKREITARIDAIENNDLRLLLRLRYINNRTWEKIAAEMHFSYVHVAHNLHPKAIRAFELKSMS